MLIVCCVGLLLGIIPFPVVIRPISTSPPLSVRHAPRGGGAQDHVDLRLALRHVRQERLLGRGEQEYSSCSVIGLSAFQNKTEP